ncbi:MAG TPA: ABC transporter ATP-binding protein [Alphaproteobacteria bacterium]|nr:ABC transporter ATP-binding protein [Alphaproteobacteria bacterium]
MAETKLELLGIAHRFADADGGAVPALDGISLDVAAGRFVCLLGPSGCGKSTLFNVVAGLLRPTAGGVRIDGEDVTGTIGTVGYMLQKDLLLPWRTVLDNVILGLELKGVPRHVARERAKPLLARYGLGGFEHRHPRALSGGMRQRAALLRTLLCDTEIVLLDEPFGALDAQTRARMQEWLLTLWSDFHKTVVFVTHDVEEAVYLSDEIVVMTPRPGRVKARLAVELPRPRPRQIASDPAFALLRQECVELLQTGDAALHGDSAAA